MMPLTTDRSSPIAAPSSDEAATGAPPLPDTYDAALGELEQLVATMEAGRLPLEALLQAYQRGADLLDFCRSRLDAVEQQVKVLDDGRLKPWIGA